MKTLFLIIWVALVVSEPQRDSGPETGDEKITNSVSVKKKAQIYRQAVSEKLKYKIEIMELQQSLQEEYKIKDTNQ